MTEMTGLEMLQVLIKNMELLHKKVDLLDLNVKKLMNDRNIKNKPKIVSASAPTTPDIKPNTGIRNFKFEPTKNLTCMCEGKMIINNGGQETPLPDLSVKIYDNKNNLVKETKTNRGGIWMSKLPVGKFVVEVQGKCGNKDLYPVNIPFEVLPGMDKLEVK